MLFGAQKKTKEKKYIGKAIEIFVLSENGVVKHAVFAVVSPAPQINF
jgi:hypothetical protein